MGTLRARSPLFVAALPLIAATGCGEQGAARAQLIVFVDTDAPVAAQATTDTSLSMDASVNTVRIDVLDDRGVIVDSNQFGAPDAASWPLSFGVPASPSSGPTRLRVRVFRSDFAGQGSVDGRATFEPPAAVAIERLVEADVPTTGVRKILVRLSGDCWGVPSSYVEPVRTCIDGAHAAEDPRSGVDDVTATPASSIGSWPGARALPCSSAGDRLCIPGGFVVLGDLSLVGISDVDRADSAPLRPAIVSASLLDRTEFTVGRLRMMVTGGQYAGALPTLHAAAAPFCTWLGKDDGTNDALPLNCVTWTEARALCKADGGELPTEAAWEHAARGRGNRLTYPWGNTATTCCMASASRAGPPEVATECPYMGIEPVGSHPSAELCNHLGDVSRDGILDLAGSMSEAMLDSFQSFASPCWGATGVPHDPRCEDTTIPSHSGRGGSWNAGLADTRVALRDRFVDGAPTSGFRCAYAVEP